MPRTSQQSDHVPPLSFLANKQITQQQYKQNKELIQDLLQASPSVRWSTPFYRMRNKATERVPVPQQQIKKLALEKKYKIFSHIKQKQKTGFDVFPLFFMDIGWVQGLDALWQTFETYFNLVRNRDREKSLFYLGNVNNRFYWFIVNWFSDRNKKLFVVYERTSSSGRVSEMLRIDHYGNINIPTLPPYPTVNYTTHLEKLQEFFQEASLVGVYPIDYSFRRDFNTNTWVTPQAQV